MNGLKVMVYELVTKAKLLGVERVQVWEWGSRYLVVRQVGGSVRQYQGCKDALGALRAARGMAKRNHYKQCVGLEKIILGEKI